MTRSEYRPWLEAKKSPFVYLACLNVRSVHRICYVQSKHPSTDEREGERKRERGGGGGRGEGETDRQTESQQLLIRSEKVDFFV